jgi:O-antigen ligase
MKRCPDCGAKHPDDVLTCDCGRDLTGASPIDDGGVSAPTRPVRPNDDRWPVLRLFAGILDALALVSGIGVIAAALYVLIVGTPTWFGPPRVWLSVGILVGGGLHVLLLLAAGEAIRALLDIERNTRRTAAAEHSDSHFHLRRDHS